MATKGRFGATQLKKELAKLAKSAWAQPVALTRYHARWGWIVSHSMWLKKIGFAGTPVPQTHPLLRLRQHVDKFLYGKAGALAPALPVETEDLLPGQVIRILVLQTVHRIESSTELYEEIEYNLLYRQFVGIDAELPPIEVFVALVQTVRGDPRVLRWLKRILRDAPLQDIKTSSGMPAGMEVLEAWLAESQRYSAD